MLALECEMSAVHGLLSRIPETLSYEQVIVMAQQLFEKHPPKKLARNEGLKLSTRSDFVPSGYIHPTVFVFAVVLSFLRTITSQDTLDTNTPTISWQGGSSRPPLLVGGLIGYPLPPSPSSSDC